MFIANGYVYGGHPEEPIRVKNVRTLPDMMMLLTFNTGEVRLFDASTLTGKVFEPLSNPDVFSTAAVEYGTVVWDDGNIDCAPEYMYENSYEYRSAYPVAS